MSDQEIAVVEKEEADAAGSAPVVSDSTHAEVTPELSPDSETSSSTPPQEVAETISSEELPPSPETEEFDPSQLSIHTLRRGQHLTGRVKNITEFGAFIDLGIAQDGLVHISELARRKVDKVTDVVNQGQEVDVWVKKVDKKRGRISLTMIKPVMLKLKDIVEDAEVEGTVTRLEAYGAFVDIGSDRDGLIHISQITHDYIKHPSDALQVGDSVTVKVLKVNRKKRQIDLSRKALLAPPPPKEEVKVVEEVKQAPEPVRAAEHEEVVEDEPLPTAMAIAYAALHGDPGGRDRAGNLKNKRRRRRDMDDIVERTLANRGK